MADISSLDKVKIILSKFPVLIQNFCTKKEAIVKILNHRIFFSFNEL